MRVFLKILKGRTPDVIVVLVLVCGAIYWFRQPAYTERVPAGPSMVRDEVPLTPEVLVAFSRDLHYTEPGQSIWSNGIGIDTMRHEGENLVQSIAVSFRVKSVEALGPRARVRSLDSPRGRSSKITYLPDVPSERITDFLKFLVDTDIFSSFTLAVPPSGKGPAALEACTAPPASSAVKRSWTLYLYLHGHNAFIVCRDAGQAQFDGTQFRRVCERFLSTLAPSLVDSFPCPALAGQRSKDSRLRL